MKPASTTRLPFHRRHPRWTLLIAALVVATLVFGVLELVLRIVGYRPGYLWTFSGQFQPQTELGVSHEFFTDSTAIFRALPDSFNYKPGYYVNRHGFRSPEFEQIDTTRTKLLLIGDSFLWGATAKPIDSAFADRIADQGYSTINLGIPGADPDQYALVAGRYIPQLRPDAVCVFFYMGNDCISQRRKLEPWKNRYHVTYKAGWINPYLDHVSYMGGPDTTYAWYEKRFSLPEGTWWNNFSRKTVAFTMLWQAKLNYIGVEHCWHPDIRDSAKVSIDCVNADSGQISLDYLAQVQAYCQASNTPCLLFFIPLHTSLGESPFARYPYLQNGLEWEFPQNLVRDDFNEWPDGHFNNTGHRKYADFVLKTLVGRGILPQRQGGQP